jgi:hypothetical protein
MWYLNFCLVAIEMKSDTLAFDCLAGGGHAFSDLTVLFDFRVNEGVSPQLFYGSISYL